MKVQIFNTTFIGNVGQSNGGAINVGFNPYIEIVDCKFIANICTKGQGGAVNLVNFILPHIPMAIIL